VSTFFDTGAALEVLAWRPASVAVLRLAGFPFGWLDRLTDTAVTAVALERLRTDGDLARFAVRAQDPGLRSAAGNAADHAVLRALRRGRAYSARPEQPTAEFAALLAEFTAAVRQRDLATAALQDAYTDACQTTGRSLVQLFRETPALRDMLLVSNEEAHPRLIRWIDDPGLDTRPPRKQDRNNVATLARYLQRVCAKNDTTSHFGPLATARLTDERPGVPWSPTGLTRHPMLSRWAAEAIARSLARDSAVRDLVRPRRSPGAYLDGAVLHVVRIDQALLSTDVRDAVRAAAPVVLTGDERLLYGLCDGTATWRQISDTVAGLRPEADPAALLDRLTCFGAVLPGPELPYGDEDSLAGLTDLVAGLAEQHPARRICAQVTAAVDALAHAAPARRPDALTELKDLFTAVTGDQAARRRGGFYSDRSVFHEHCLCTPDGLTIGPPLTDRMRDELGLLYDMFLLRPRWRLRLERELLAGWFAHRFGSQAVPATHYLAAYLADLDLLEPRYRTAETRVGEIADALEAALLPADGGLGHEHVVDRAAVADLVQRYGVAEPAVCNPDLMVAAASHADLAAGRFRLVIGDLHAMEDHLSHGSIAPFVDAAFPHYRRELIDLYAGLLEPGEQLADVTQYHLNKTFPRIDLDCLDIEAFGRSGRAEQQRLRLGDLSVHHDGGRLRLRGPSGSDLRLVIAPHAWPMLRRNPFAVFGFPADTEGAAVHGTGHPHVPRIRVGDVVLQREFWRLPAGKIAAGTVGEEPGAFLRVQQLRVDLDLPRHVYLRCAGEPKPVYCDLDSPLLVRQLTRMASALPPDADVTVSEMLPGPGDLWLDDGHGGRTSEIRYAVFTVPPH